MRSITKTIFTVVALSVFFLSAERVTACSFDVYFNVPFCAQFAATDAVFMGKVIDSQPFVDGNEKFNRLTIAVEKVFKGQSSETIELLNLAQAETSCDVVIDIGVGEKWIFLADFNHNKTYLVLKTNSFKFDLAKNSKEFNYLNERVDYLYKVANGTTQTELHGQIAVLGHYPPERVGVKNFKVVAESNGQRLTTQTDEEGSFHFSDLPAKTYKIKIYFPFKAVVALEKETGDRNQIETSFDQKSKHYVYEYEMTAKNKECVYKAVVIFNPHDIKMSESVR